MPAKGKIGNILKSFMTFRFIRCFEEEPMPTIVVANPKGGCGKSTTCLVLASTLRASGATVALIDADPQQTIWRWSKAKKSRYADMVSLLPAGEDLMDLIDRLRRKVQFVIIDPLGSAEQAVGESMSRADLVLIPMQAKTADAEVTVRAFQQVRAQEKVLRRIIPHSLVFTRTNALIATREEKRIAASISANGLPLNKVRLNERTAYSVMFELKLALDELDPEHINGLEEARANAGAFAAEVIDMLGSAARKAA
jgi:chromosome partitioning protein